MARGDTPWLEQIAIASLPIVLSAIGAFLWQISRDLSAIQTSLAVAVQKLDDHERRMVNLERLTLGSN